ncbi:MAG TPA: family 1 glycosylhydrolase [Verrucomicrobiae bacterium]|nr:family 1 glycosylhydrolase [Verrucomicrobiae bacterium]
MALTRSNLGRLTEDFFWSAGIEDTFIVDPWPQTGRILDEYELTGHYEKFREDIQLMADLGVRIARYGVPWYRINPKPGKWDWSWADGPLECLLQKGIEPIVDLVHYGVPGWIEGAFANPDFPERMSEYSARLAARFRGRIHAYTPLNEPRITAWYCGKLGWWPPYRRGWRGFVQLMLGICRGIVKTVEALHGVDPEILPVHVDATDLYETNEPDLQEEAKRRQEIVFLALDLISGRIKEEHALLDWLLKMGVAEEELSWFQEHAVDLPMIGINLYPMYSRKVLVSTARGLKIRMPYSSADIVSELADMYWRRYGRPLFISETASMGSIKRRRTWLETSVEAVKKVRERGVQLVGYTWWPMLAIVTWAYRQGTRPPEFYLKQMGLWNVESSSEARLRRTQTPLVDLFQKLVADGSEAAGKLAYKTKGV